MIIFLNFNSTVLEFTFCSLKPTECKANAAKKVYTYALHLRRLKGRERVMYLSVYGVCMYFTCVVVYERILCYEGNRIDTHTY